VTGRDRASLARQANGESFGLVAEMLESMRVYFRSGSVLLRSRMSSVAEPMTAEELLKLPRGKARYELIRGRLITIFTGP
jgi:hypothetical protein